MKSNNVSHEKGVDVKLAVDMLVATYENLCDRILLISSDTDLLPAIKKAREKGKIVEYVGFKHKPSVAMVANCDEVTLLKKPKFLRKFPGLGVDPEADKEEVTFAKSDIISISFSTA